MAIGTLAAIGIGLAGAGAVASSSAQKSAANKAASASNYAADQSAAVLRENYDKSAQALAPWQNSGLAANNQINALLGLGGSAGMPATLATPGTPNYAGYVQANPDLVNDFNKVAGRYGNDMATYGQYHWNRYGQFEPGRSLPTAGGSQGMPGAPQQTSTEAARAAFDQFRNSTGYQFRLGQGMDAVNSGYAGAGTVKSGAAMKAINDYGQNMASGEFANYMGMLGNQQALGANAASAQAGVSQNMGNSLANIAMQKGDNAANAALAKGSSGFGNALSLIGGGLFKLGA